MLTSEEEGTSVPAMAGRASMTGWKRAVLTAVLAYALVLQALAFSFGGALHAAAAGLPQAVLCAPGTADSAPDPASDKGHDVLCCTLACHGQASPTGPVPAAAALDRPFHISAADPEPYEAPFLRLSSSILPVGSRAPPHIG
jgi:hypothetical protein